MIYIYIKDFFILLHFLYNQYKEFIKNILQTNLWYIFCEKSFIGILIPPSINSHPELEHLYRIIKIFIDRLIESIIVIIIFFLLFLQPFIGIFKFTKKKWLKFLICAFLGFWFYFVTLYIHRPGMEFWKTLFMLYFFDIFLIFFSYLILICPWFNFNQSIKIPPTFIKNFKNYGGFFAIFFYINAPIINLKKIKKKYLIFFYFFCVYFLLCICMLIWILNTNWYYFFYAGFLGGLVFLYIILKVLFFIYISYHINSWIIAWIILESWDFIWLGPLFCIEISAIIFCSWNLYIQLKKSYKKNKHQ